MGCLSALVSVVCQAAPTLVRVVAPACANLTKASIAPSCTRLFPHAAFLHMQALSYPISQALCVSLRSRSPPCLSRLVVFSIPLLLSSLAVFIKRASGMHLWKEASSTVVHQQIPAKDLQHICCFSLNFRAVAVGQRQQLWQRPSSTNRLL